MCSFKFFEDILSSARKFEEVEYTVHGETYEFDEFIIHIERVVNGIVRDEVCLFTLLNMDELFDIRNYKWIPFKINFEKNEILVHMHPSRKLLNDFNEYHKSKFNRKLFTYIVIRIKFLSGKKPEITYLGIEDMPKVMNCISYIMKKSNYLRFISDLHNRCRYSMKMYVIRKHSESENFPIIHSFNLIKSPHCSETITYDKDLTIDIIDICGIPIYDISKEIANKTLGIIIIPKESKFSINEIDRDISSESFNLYFSKLVEEKGIIMLYTWTAALFLRFRKEYINIFDMKEVKEYANVYNG